MKKRVLFLGASAAQIPPIQYALQSGYYVITADYLPDNPGHQLAHESYNISTTDKEGIQALAEVSHIDGIVAYASDPAAPTAAYVAEKLGLPGNPWMAVSVLSEKDSYRTFLKKNGFATPRFIILDGRSNINSFQSPLQLPIVAKPVDNCGSKGITIVHTSSDFPAAYAQAMVLSRKKHVIVEEFIGESSCRLTGEGFIWENRLLYAHFAYQRFNDNINGIVPIGADFPIEDENLSNRIYEELKRLIRISGLRMGGINIEVRVDLSGKIYLMEVAPRSGGNLLPQLITQATKFDVVKNTVEIALGGKCKYSASNRMNGFYAYYVIHSEKSGILDQIDVSPDVNARVVESGIWAHPGDRVDRFTRSDASLGVLILRFDSRREMRETMDAMTEKVTVHVK